MCWHKWSKWKQLTINYKKRFDDGEVIEFIKHFQERECIKCGYTQRREIEEGII